MNKNRIPDRKAKKVGEILAVLMVFLTFTSTALALNHYYPAKLERVIDGDTIVADLSLGLGVVLDDQIIRFYGIDAWETRGEERPRGLLAKVYVEERLQEEERRIKGGNDEREK